MKRSALLVSLGVLALLCSLPAAQQAACDVLQDPTWIEWPAPGLIKGDGRLLSLNLDNSGSSDLVLLPSRSNPSIPHVMLDANRWMRGGALCEGEQMLDIVVLDNPMGRDALITGSLAGLAHWSLAPGGDHLLRQAMLGPWSTGAALEVYTSPGNPWGVLAVQELDAKSVYLQLCKLGDPDMRIDLGVMLAPQPIADFALVDFFGNDGAPELAVLDSRGITLFDLSGNQLSPSIPNAAGESGKGQLISIERCCQAGQDLYWISTGPGGEVLNFLDRLATHSQVPLPGFIVESLQIKDVDANGVPELLLFDQNLGLRLMVNHSGVFDSSFNDKDLLLFDESMNSSPVALADLDHDGDLDLIADGKLFAGDQLSPDQLLPKVDPDSFSFGFERWAGPPMGVLSLNASSAGNPPSATPAAGTGQGPLPKPAPPANANGSTPPGNSTGPGTLGLVGRVNRIKFNLIELEKLPSDANELMIEVYADFQQTAESLQDTPVASVSIPITSTIELALTPLDNVSYHYFNIRPRRVIPGQTTWSYPTLSFRWQPQGGADASYAKPKPEPVCSGNESRFGRSGPVPVIPVTFLGSWPSFY